MNQENNKKTVESIRAQYTPHEESKLERLQKIDGKVKLPGKIFAYTFGVIGALVFGLGMCLAMQIIGRFMLLGIFVGIVGMAMVIVNYFFYCAITASRKKKYADQIVALSNELLHENA